MNNYDYIIIGAGASGLLLADALGKDVFFANKKILLLDKDAKKTNDRTWCFWEKKTGQFDEMVHAKWKEICFIGKETTLHTPIFPYVYKMIRGIDFYQYYFNRIATYANITFKQEEVLDLIEATTAVSVITTQGTYLGDRIFSSLFKYKMATHQTKYPVLQQHFVGWEITTEAPVFNPDEVTYMDFSVAQKGNTRFMYVLPYNAHTALVEYTLFSKTRLEKEEYDYELKKYIANLVQNAPYTIVAKEQGSIPMTCYDFRAHNTNRVRYIGTAGGWAKPSTGYTLMSTAKKIPKLVALLKKGSPMKKLTLKNKFWWYDLLFLDVLSSDNKNGHQIFEALFKKQSPQMVFKFLDEETNILEDIKYINSCPKTPFLKAIVKRFFKK